MISILPVDAEHDEPRVLSGRIGSYIRKVQVQSYEDSPLAGARLNHAPIGSTHKPLVGNG